MMVNKYLPNVDRLIQFVLLLIYMDYYPPQEEKLFSKKNVITYLIMAIIIVAIPIAVRLARTQQALRSQAAVENPITFPDLRKNAQGDYETKVPEIEIKVESPFGPATSPTQTQ